MCWVGGVKSQEELKRRRIMGVYEYGKSTLYTALPPSLTFKNSWGQTQVLITQLSPSPQPSLPQWFLLIQFVIWLLRSISNDRECFHSTFLNSLPYPPPLPTSALFCFACVSMGLTRVLGVAFGLELFIGAQRSHQWSHSWRWRLPLSWLVAYSAAVKAKFPWAPPPSTT